MKTDSNILSIIIVNYNTVDMLERCLNSITSQEDIRPEVIVIDNDSQDNSQDMVKELFPWAKLIANRQNLGFASANNQALKVCQGRYVYFLNPDTEVLQGALLTMIEFMESHPEIGLAGTRIINPDRSPQESVVKRYPGEKYSKSELRGLKGNIAWVLGASMIARSDLVKELGGFDERFFLYGDEQDLCISIRRAGHSIGHVPDATVVHWGGQSERKTLPAEVWKKKYKAELIFYNKHYSKRTIRAIRRKNIIFALWRIITLRLSLPFCKNKKTSLNKLDRYRVLFQTFRNEI